ncbi:hypothetical protein [Mucilaginibacter polytrichastri]|uniref:Uncharacterized protein n=1 Tax=Mucilaginibacter polytrichastri TaxID=1302689 RepID=A0A1Q6A0W6_9SPHI|nr:hypothetical protein [Mucilaginibacter polytrichastri]OKS87622.1 hypothetical protein RG47T_3083 [Mucilaginibacter polytrichastri]SFS92942.1 hypothetical protein SAMN04487890_106214 [Mucilaginibacter polytrichastri]
MKYTFLFGSNAFIVDQPVITYLQDGEPIELIRIKSIYAPSTNPAEQKVLVVDTHITDTLGHTITLADNDYEHSDYKVKRTNNQIHVTNSTDHTVLDVLQLDTATAGHLSSHIINELHNVGETHVLRIRGDFMIGEHHITVDNEKLYIDDDIYAESVHVGHNGGIQLSKDGVRV